METKPNDSIYPHTDYEEQEDLGGLMEIPVQKYGLTKREYFAAMAMQGRLAAYGMTGDPDFAKDCLALADELIEALNEQKEPF